LSAVADWRPSTGNDAASEEKLIECRIPGNGTLV
jgi:hypothetical protein